MDRRLPISTAIAALALGLAALPVSAMTRTVNCDKGQTIQAAIEKSESRAERLEIFVSGTCNENVVIRRSEVTIDGGGATTIRVQVSFRLLRSCEVSSGTISSKPKSGDRMAMRPENGLTKSSGSSMHLPKNLFIRS